MTDKRLIEDSLPLEAISRQSAREKSSGPGHISTLHTWWARRPLAGMRAAIFASLVSAPADESERKNLHAVIEDMMERDAVKTPDDERIVTARKLLNKRFPDAPPRVLDPFMGGGSTGLEALRLGCETHSIELNPVAYIVELCTIVYPQQYGQPITKDPTTGETTPFEDAGMQSDGLLIENPLADDVQKWGNWLLTKLRRKLGPLYEDPFGHTIVAYIWARTAICPNPACRAEMPMLRQTWLAKRPNRRVALRMLVDNDAKSIDFEVVEGDALDFDPSEMTMKRGTIVCPVCNNSPNRDFLVRQAEEGRLGSRLLAVAYTVKGKPGKQYRIAVDEDLSKLKSATKALRTNEDTSNYKDRDELIPPESTKIDPRRYGAIEWRDLFAHRQLNFVSAMADMVRNSTEEIRAEVGDELYARAIITYLGILVDRMANLSNMYCRWNSAGENLKGAYSRQAIAMVWDFAELNPFSNAAGDLSSAITWVVRAVKHFAYAGKVPARALQGNAAALPYEDYSIDAVVTDPPYYDHISYAELSDFFYVWLRRSLGHLYPDIFLTPLTPKSAEIIQRPGGLAGDRAKAKVFYEEKMTVALREIQRTLTEDGISVVVFAHKSTAAWETLLNSLLVSGLVVTASWPLHTEMATRLGAQNTASLASSIFIVCRKRVTDDAGQFDSVRRELLERVKERLDFFWEQGIRGADFFISAIGPAVEVFGKYSVVRKLTGDEVGVAELLDLVQESVADYTLSRVLNGRYQMGAVDAPTRFYVMYRWSYNKQRLDFDDGRRLAQALGAEVDGLIRVDKIVRQRGAKITVPDSSLRGDEERLGEVNRDGDAAPLINLLHRSLLIWQKSGRQELADFLALHGQGREDAMHVVAQSIVSVLPDNDEERRTLENYLQGSDALPDARQVGLGLEM